MKRLRTLLLVALLSAPAWAARISDLGSSNWSEQLSRFLRLSDPSVRFGLAGTGLLGLTCGLLGAYIVLRRLSMMGDTLGHSVLPGVVLGFVVAGHKSLPALTIGAALAGLAAALSVWALNRWSPLKEDTNMGLVMSGYFALGIMALTMVAHSGNANQAGLDKFLFGQAAALGPSDVLGLALVSLLTLLAVTLLYKELLVTSFDPGFARSLGLPTEVIHVVLMSLVTLAIVTSIQAVGVVLVSAMLVIPAATAHLLTDRMPVLLALSAFFGTAAGLLGMLVSFVGAGLPTGPCMVLAAFSAFVLAWLLAPRQGVLSRWWTQRQRRHRFEREHTLKAIYRVLETKGRHGPVALGELTSLEAERRRSRLRALARNGMARLDADSVELTEAGLAQARRVVRNHRLWEVYLTQRADIAPDHVHRDADLVEHLLTDEQVAQIEERLGSPVSDPHGRPIPRSGEDAWK